MNQFTCEFIILGKFALQNWNGHPQEDRITQQAEGPNSKADQCFIQRWRVFDDFTQIDFPRHLAGEAVVCTARDSRTAAFPDCDVLRPNHKRNRLARCKSAREETKDLAHTRLHWSKAIGRGVLQKRSMQQIGAADEIGDEFGSRPAINVLGRADLRDLAIVHHGDAV